MLLRPTRSTRTDTRFPYAPLFRSAAAQGLPRCAFHLPASRPAPSAGQHARWLAVRRLPHVLRAARMAGAGVVVPAGAGVARAVGQAARGHRRRAREIGRASCRERVCQYLSISVVAESFKKKNTY